MMYSEIDQNSFIFKLDLSCSKIELSLDEASAYPVLGTIPALLKTLFGLTQFTYAIAAIIVSPFFLLQNFSLQDYLIHALRHVLHGLINMISGLIQAIPVVGTLIYILKNFNTSISDSFVNSRINHETNKFFGYQTVRDITWEKVEGDQPPYNIDNMICAI
jgi:hypothetical protein